MSLATCLHPRHVLDTDSNESFKETWSARIEKGQRQQALPLARRLNWLRPSLRLGPLQLQEALRTSKAQSAQLRRKSFFWLLRRASMKIMP